MTLSWPMALGFGVGLLLAKVAMLALEDWLSRR